MSQTCLKVTDLDLILTYFSRSNKFLEGLLVTYQLHISSDQLLHGIVGACGNVSYKSKVNDLHFFSTIENVRKRRET